MNEQMKGIACCGDCAYYDWKKHRCQRAKVRGNSQSRFYVDCPLHDVRPVVRGHWILDSDPGEPWKYRCDQCGATTTDTCMGKPRANWCPLCGAYMGEEGETLRTQQQLRKRKCVSRDRVFIEFADWANETGATNTQNFSDRLRAIPTVDVSEDTKDV